MTADVDELALPAWARGQRWWTRHPKSREMIRHVDEQERAMFHASLRYLLALRGPHAPAPVLDDATRLRFRILILRHDPWRAAYREWEQRMVAAWREPERRSFDYDAETAL